MKHILFAILLLSAFSVMAEADSTKVKKVKTVSPEEQAKKDAVEKKFSKFAKDRFAIDLLATNWIYDKNGPGFNGLQTKWFSRGINVYFYYDFRIKKSRFSIAPGIGYSSSNIYSRRSMIEDSVGTHFGSTDLTSDYKVNKITLQYLDIPVEFRIKTNPDKLDQCWKFVLGFKVGVRVDAHTKDKIKTGNDTHVYVERRFPDFNLLRFGPMIRIGYSSFNLTAYYGVLDVFKKGLGPKANEFAFGISFNGL